MVKLMQASTPGTDIHLPINGDRADHLEVRCEPPADTLVRTARDSIFDGDE